MAESCTAGLIAKLLTDSPGASNFFLADLVTYSNRAKTSLLGVPEELLAQHGAVSAQCARAMAEGVRNAAGADLEVYVYPQARHAYAQPLYAGGDNLDPVATEATWAVLESFFRRNLGD